MPRHRGDTGCKLKVTVTSARYRLWRAMRMQRRFTIADLVATAEAAPRNTELYVAALEKAGYLRIIRPRISGAKMGGAIYMMVNDTGPNPPRLGKRGLSDPNLQKADKDMVR